ncbi:universal stress protein [Nonlabens sp. Ci31]|jgi:nucleotide-binding universal stress UspA family protein|uniref:universal stress protein n=1 Tax=Nonlabens sp. Ci31 TaxID=2608253 RepID=UPI0014647102|nr:universal stress protein [Nonlabens sp. Ci31]QJP35674.1 universal stress protein [Nonlabens sp. Ci31]
MLRVLLPTDFSTHSYNALSYAQQLFSKVAVEFTLFHAYEPTVLQMLGNISPQRLASIYQDWKLKSVHQLNALQSQILQTSQPEFHQYAVEAYEGHLTEGIAAFEKGACDYIIMGSKGSTGLKEIFLGSVTYSVVSLQQEIPILIIPENASFKTLEKVGLETDFKESYSKAVLQPLLLLTKIWGATLHLVQVYSNPDLSTLEENHLQHLKTILKDIPCSFHVIPKFSSLENCIHVFEEDLEIDIMVLIDYPLNFFDRLMGKSIVRNITFHTSLPFLILPTPN